jgi:uncharacterized LabA/DUF88 family protein
MEGPGKMKSPENQRVAVFFDVDNLWLSARDAGVPFDVARVVQAARQEGRVMVAKAYGDWANHRHLLPEFSRNAIEMTELATGYGGKNTADIQIATDVMEIALSGHQPDTIVLVSGDRDFVPLVQKVRRYGIRVVAIGVEGTVSGVLQRACDAFLSYVDFFAPAVMPAPVEATPTSELVTAAEPLPPDQAFPLLLRAARVAEQNFSMATDALTLQLISELEPSFDLDAYGLTLRELARAAEDAGLLVVTDLPDGTFTFTAQGEAPSPAADGGVGEPTLRAVFDSPGEAANRYRAILMAKRVPLLPFETRRQLVHHLWQAFTYYQPRGMSFAMMNETLTQFAHSSGLSVPFEAIRKLTFTLNIGRSLSPDGGEGQFVRNPDMFRDYFLPVVDEDRALDEMHRTYIAGVRMEHPDIDLVPEGVALLLFDSRESWATERARNLLDDVVAGRRVAYSSAPALSLGGQVGRISIGSELLRAVQTSVEAIDAAGKKATGSAVRDHLAQTYPPFLLVESTTPFKTIARMAAEKGYVSLTETPGMDFLLHSSPR